MPAWTTEEPMFQQLLIAYTAGMTLAIGIEVARTLKACRP